ncbi:uncharacterized protein [Macaca nemestrina]|uniref:uncharacterized protein n=1 Tax=Macaca nemestrina TaxID=9545 RepID=UPI0039B9A460
MGWAGVTWGQKPSRTSSPNGAKREPSPHYPHTVISAEELVPPTWASCPNSAVHHEPCRSPWLQCRNLDEPLRLGLGGTALCWKLGTAQPLRLEDEAALGVCGCGVQPPPAMGALCPRPILSHLSQEGSSNSALCLVSKWIQMHQAVSHGGDPMHRQPEGVVQAEAPSCPKPAFPDSVRPARKEPLMRRPVGKRLPGLLVLGPGARSLRIPRPQLVSTPVKQDEAGAFHQSLQSPALCSAASQTPLDLPFGQNGSCFIVKLWRSE